MSFGDGRIRKISMIMAALVLLSGSLVTVVSGNDGSSTEETRYTPPAMGKWGMLTGGGWPANITVANCHIMSRDGGKEFVVFNRAQEGWTSWYEVYSFFVENETWFRWNATGTWPDTQYSDGRSFASTPDGEMGFYFGGNSWGSGSTDKLNVFFYSNKTWVRYTAVPTLGARYGTALTYDPISQKLYIFGGRTSSGWRNDIHTFSLTMGWAQLTPPDPKPAGRDQALAALSSNGTRLYIALGRYNTQGWTNYYKNDVWEYVVTNNTWREVDNDLGIPNDRSAIFLYRPDTDDLLLSNGLDGSNGVNNTYVIQIANGAQTRVYVQGGMSRRGIQGWDLMQDGRTALVLGDTSGTKDIWELDIYSIVSVLGPGNPIWAGGSAFTGYDPEDGGKLIALKRLSGSYWQLAHFSLSDKKWHNSSVTDQNTPTYRDGMAYVYDPKGNDFYLYGGYYSYQVGQNQYHYYFYDEFWKYSIDSNSWTRVKEHAYPGPRGRADMVIDAQGDTIYLFGGQIPGGDTNKLHKYDISGDLWTDITPAISPGGRMQTSLCYFAKGTGFYMFGGRNNGTSSASENDFWFFHTDSGMWEQLTGAENPPDARYDTGLSVDPATEEVLVFGMWEGQWPSSTAPEYFIWRPGWVSWESHPSNNDLHDWFGHGQVYDPSTGSHYIWASSATGDRGSGTEVWEFKPILRTSAVYIELLRPEGTPTTSAFPTVGTYKLHCRGRTDMPFSDILGYNITIKMGAEDYTLIWMRSGSMTEAGNLSWVDITTLPTFTPGTDGRWDIYVSLEFLFGTPHRTPADVIVTPITDMAFVERATKIKAFTVYSDLIIKEYHFGTPLQSSVTPGSWLWGRTQLTVDSFTVVFDGAPDVSPKVDDLTVEFIDSKDHSGMWTYEFNTTGSITLPIEGMDKELVTYELNLFREGTELLDGNTFQFRLDLDAPSEVINATLRADSVTDRMERMDNDRDELFLTWDDIIERGAGLKAVCYSLDVNLYPSDLNQTVKFFNIHESVEGHIIEGFHTLYVWAIDNVSRAGPWTEIPFVIDLHKVLFEEKSPDPSLLINTTKTTYRFSLVITDALSGIDLSTVEYRQSMPDRQYSAWKKYDVGTGNASVVEIDADLDLVPGIKNLVQFRARDMAKNIISESRVFQVNSFPDLAVPSAWPLTPVDKARVNKDVTLTWKGAYYDLDRLTYELHIIDPKGVELIKSLPGTSFTFRAKAPGTYRWFIVALAEGLTNKSAESTFMFSPPFVNVELPSRIEVTIGKEVAVQVTVTNTLETNVNMTLVLPDPKGFRLKEGGSQSLDPLQQKAFYLVLNSSDATAGNYKLLLRVSDDFGRSATFNLSMVVTTPIIDRPDDDGGEEGIPLWAIIAAVVIVIVLIGALLFFLMRRKDKDEEEGEEEVEEAEPDLHYDPTGKVAEGGSGSKHTVQLTPGLHTSEEDMRRGASNVMEITLPTKGPSVHPSNDARGPPSETEEEEMEELEELEE